MRVRKYGPEAKSKALEILNSGFRKKHPQKKKLC